MLYSQTQTDNEGMSTKCVLLFTQYYLNLFKYFLSKIFKMQIFQTLKCV